MIFDSDLSYSAASVDHLFDSGGRSVYDIYEGVNFAVYMVNRNRKEWMTHSEMADRIIELCETNGHGIGIHFDMRPGAIKIKHRTWTQCHQDIFVEPRASVALRMPYNI
jgi:hypothetical protein